MGIGEEPVGRPRTKGFSAVGANSLILYKHEIGVDHSGKDLPSTDVVGNVVANSGRIFANNQTYYQGSCQHKNPRKVK